MKRSPMKRIAPLKTTKPMARGKSMAKRSRKQRAVYDGDDNNEGRRKFVERILSERPRCQAGLKLHGDKAGALAADKVWLPRSDGGWFVACDGAAVDVHEILPRSAGGSVVDESNVLAVCRFCHEAIHANGKRARELGLLASRYSR